MNCFGDSRMIFLDLEEPIPFSTGSGDYLLPSTSDVVKVVTGIFESTNQSI